MAEIRGASRIPLRFIWATRLDVRVKREVGE